MNPHSRHEPRDPALPDTIRTADYERLHGVIVALGLGEEQTQLVLSALSVAAAAHEGQTRPDGTAYVHHPVRVALSVAIKFEVGDPALLMAALLHDTVEDKAKELVEALGGDPSSSAGIRHEAFACIRQHFGARTAEVVERLTNPDFDELARVARENGDSRDTASIKRELYKEHFLEILEKDPEAFLIKLCDFAENAYNLGQLSEERRAKLALKYGPVMVAVRDALSALDGGHSLFRFKDSILAELDAVYERDYR
jgi:(p)ppGpp synthase/HD superfamily hydrolase